MAYSVDYSTGVISIPQSDLIFLEAGKYKLDLDEFRRKCRDLEAQPSNGLSYPPMVEFNTVVDTGDVILARVVLLINGYTVTFEDGQYAVLFDGANTNVHNFTNVNQVSVRPNNSTGLQDLSTLLASAYQGRVVVDIANGQSGTSTPIGTYGKPSNNIQDAVTIAGIQGLGELYIIGNLTLSAGDDVSNLKIIGSAPTLSFITVEDASSTLKTQFSRCTLAGILDGYSTLEDSVLWDMSYFSGTMHQIALTDSTITLGGGASAVMLHCYAVTSGGVIPTVDMGGSGQSLNVGNYNGDIKLINKTGTDAVDIYFNSGHAFIDSTVTDGVINIYGGQVTDNSTGTAVVNHFKPASKSDVINAAFI